MNLHLEFSGDMGRGRYRVKSGVLQVVRDDIYIIVSSTILGAVLYRGADVDIEPFTTRI